MQFRNSIRSIALAGVALLVASGAQAVQFTPNGTSLLHTETSGQPGAQWNTGGAGAGGGISYSSTTGTLSVTGVIDVLNYFDTTNGSCATDVGSNCAVNFSPDLDFTAEMQISSINVSGTAIPDTILVDIALGSTPDGNPDLVWTDPSDGTVVLEADWTNGIFNGQTVNGVMASVFYNTATGTAQFNSGLAPQTGFLAVDAGSLYAGLFDAGTGLFGIDISTLSSFVGAGGGLNEIITAAVGTGVLPDFTAEGNGQTFRLAAGQFIVPEPGTGLLVGFGLALMARRRQE